MKTALKLVRYERRKNHVRNTINLGREKRLRLSVFRSAKHVYAQIIDDVSRRTLVSASSTEKALAEQVKAAEGKIGVSTIVGKALAERAQAKDIKTVVFDRNGFGYHGRIKALADGAREGGLEF